MEFKLRYIYAKGYFHKKIFLLWICCKRRNCNLKKKTTTTTTLYPVECSASLNSHKISSESCSRRDLYFIDWALGSVFRECFVSVLSVSGASLKTVDGSTRGSNRQRSRKDNFWSPCQHPSESPSWNAHKWAVPGTGNLWARDYYLMFLPYVSKNQTSLVQRLTISQILKT